MKTIYEAANILEAQLLCDWLQQSGIHAKVEGSYLQGGVGELQAMGVVRVVVEEADYFAAVDALGQWDALHRQDQSREETLRSERVAQLGRRFLNKLGGIALAVLVILVLALWMRGGS